MRGRRSARARWIGHGGQFGLALLLIALLGLGQHWQSPVAYAATFTVNSILDEHDAVPGNFVCASAAGRCTLRAAIEEANANANSDTIVVPNGTYTLTLGELNILTSMRIAGSGAATIVQAATSTSAAATRVVLMQPSGAAIVVAMLDLTLRHGTTGLFLDADSAGGSSLDLTRVTITNNAGRGVVVFDAKLTMQDSVISNNAAGFGCTGDWQPGNLAEVTISRTSIVSNVTGDPDRDGAGIYAGDCILTVRDSTIANNLAGRGYGGGLYVLEGGAKQFVNVTFSGNAANRGGGIFVQDTQDGGSLSLQNVTLAGNAAREANGGHVLRLDENQRPSNISIRNTIISHQQPSGPACSTDNATPNPPQSFGGNVQFPGNTCQFLPAPTGSPPDLVNTDPRLGPLANNGGPTLTHALAANSRAVDLIFGDRFCPGTDQRGVTRGIDGNGDGRPGCDSGAFERRPGDVGTFSLAPSAANVAVGQRHAAALTWTVTEDTWHALKSVQVRLRDEGEAGVGDDHERTALQFQWDQEPNTARQAPRSRPGS